MSTPRFLNGWDVPPACEALLPPGDFFQISAPAGQRARRWLLPIGNRRAGWSGLRLYTPTSWRGRIYRGANRLLAYGGAAGLAHPVVTLNGGDWPLADLVGPLVPGLTTAAAYVRPDAQKVVIQLMDATGQVLGYAKYAEAPEPRALIRREAALLEGLPPGLGPRPILATPFLNGELTVQTALPGRPRSLRTRRTLAAHGRLLTRLVRPVEPVPPSSHPFLKDLLERAGEHRPRLERIVSELDGRKWPVAYMHGDLSPWNTLFWRDDFRALDWENGLEAGMAYVEAPHGLIIVAGTIRHVEPLRARRAIRNVLTRHVLPRSYRDHARHIATLAALNMLLRWYPAPADVDGFGAWLAEFVAADA